MYAAYKQSSVWFSLWLSSLWENMRIRLLFGISYLFLRFLFGFGMEWQLKSLFPRLDGTV